MIDDETRQRKSRNLRYKKAILQGLSLEAITDELYEISSESDTIRYWTDNIEMLTDALDGDIEQAHEFQTLFSEVSVKAERLIYDLQENGITEHFDDFFVGLVGGGSRYKLLGFDTYEEDYYNLTMYEQDLAQNESAKRLKRLTKDEFIRIAGQCFGVVAAFYDICYNYDYLKASFDIIQDDNASFLQTIQDIDAAYEKAESANWLACEPAVRDFENLVNALPDMAWVE